MEIIERVDGEDGVTTFTVTCRTANSIAVEGFVWSYVEDPVAYPAEEEDRNVLLSMMRGDDGISVLTFFIPEVAWDTVLKVGNTQQFDLTKVDVPLRVILTGCKDYQTAINMTEIAAALLGVKVKRTSVDLRIEVPEEAG
jgi:hypothetical protein